MAMEEGSRPKSPAQTLDRNGNPLIQFDFIQFSHQNLSKSGWKSAQVHAKLFQWHYFLSFYCGFVHSEKDCNLFDLLPGNTFLRLRLRWICPWTMLIRNPWKLVRTAPPPFQRLLPRVCRSVVETGSGLEQGRGLLLIWSVECHGGRAGHHRGI